MLGELENHFSLTRAALSTSGRVKCISLAVLFCIVTAQGGPKLDILLRQDGGLQDDGNIEVIYNLGTPGVNDSGKVVTVARAGASLGEVKSFVLTGSSNNFRVLAKDGGILPGSSFPITLANPEPLSINNSGDVAFTAAMLGRTITGNKFPHFGRV